MDPRERLSRRGNRIAGVGLGANEDQVNVPAAGGDGRIGTPLATTLDPPHVLEPPCGEQVEPYDGLWKKQRGGQVCKVGHQEDVNPGCAESKATAREMHYAHGLSGFGSQARQALAPSRYDRAVPLNSPSPRDHPGAGRDAHRQPRQTVREEADEDHGLSAELRHRVP
ncbi:hypothetical protein LZ30DRAFT_688828 [Colletotrichum cereale]|nr:hypothetical protein LZ30DRAFT_688828 [Colletotrichum cereale]